MRPLVATFSIVLSHYGQRYFLLYNDTTQRELCGFDRTREVSGKFAQEIADAAPPRHQNDAITVATVRRSSRRHA